MNIFEIYKDAYEYAKKRQMENSDPLGKDILHGEQEVFYDVHGNRIRASELNYNNNISEEIDPDFYLKYGDAGGDIEVIDDIIKQPNSQERTDLSSKLYYKDGDKYMLALGGRNIPINTPLYTSNGENLYSSANITYGQALDQGYVRATTAYDRMDRTNPDNQINNLNHLNYTNQNRVEILANGGEKSGKEFIERADKENEAKEREQAAEQAAEQARTGDMPTAPEAPEPKSIPDVASTIFQINSKAYKQNQKNLQEKYNSNSSLEITDPSPVMTYHEKVSLNVAPISKLNVSSGIGNTEWGDRLKYVLGKESTFLYELFHNEGGIVFPYTPKVDFEHKVNYERTEIMHSNLAVSHYKNTPPPTITLQADFTADGVYNARYMYGVIHFLRAISKCEFGESLFSDDERKDYAGIPPPVLYLNGYGNYMINVPVVVTSFGINFEKNKHYVHLKPENVWLPTDITISINLEIQFNLDKYKKQFDLEKYKENTLGENNIVSFNNIFYLMTDGEYINKDANGNEIDRKKGKKLSEYNIESNVRLNGSGWTW